MAVLFLSPEAPFPAVGGGALRTASLITYFAGRAAGVDRILFREPGRADPSLAFPAAVPGQSCVIALPRHRKGRLPRLLRNGRRAIRGRPALIDRFAGFRSPMEAFLAGRRYRVGIIEHFWCAPYLELLQRHCDEVWLDLHNIESVLQDRSRRVSGWITASGYSRFANAYRGLEREWLPRFDRILVTSETDRALVNGFVSQIPITVFPNTIPERSRPARVEEDVIAFSGNLAYAPNIEAVRYFAGSVWPLLRNEWPNLRWRLIGKNPEAVSRYVRREKYIELSGPVEDSIEELARAKVAVVPVRSGSGTRVKILEAWAAATPVVSTAIGAEGLPVCDGEHLLLANDAKRFAETVSECLASQVQRSVLGEAGRLLYERSFTWPAGWRLLDRELDPAAIL